jgi:hypothetical protein
MIKLEKNGGIKILSPESKLIEILLTDGWVEVVEKADKKKK